jgi:hypothetical protein
MVARVSQIIADCGIQIARAFSYLNINPTGPQPEEGTVWLSERRF